MAKKKYDFAGWATRCNIKCSDGRTIKPGAFSEDNGKTVPLVWMHMHDDPENVLGHAYLEDRGKEGVYAYCTLNNTPKGKAAREIVKNGDVAALSIYANQLKQNDNRDVLHGCIRELSLVLAGANRGAYIVDNNTLSHMDEDGFDENLPDDGFIIRSDFGYDNVDENEGEYVEHADKEEAPKEEKKEEPKVAENNDQTIADVYNDMTDEQKDVVAFFVGQALQDAGVSDEDDEDEEDEEMAEHSIFEQDNGENSLQHVDFDALKANAKRAGSWREAIKDAEEDGVLSHADLDTDIAGSSMTTATGSSTYGFNDPDMLFPEFHELYNTPAWIKRDTEWVSTVMNGTKHSPFARLRTTFANITNDEARARGYVKGKLKKEEVFSLLRRTIDPQTIYKKQKMDRDDQIDITGFDVIAWLKGEMRIMLDEELARAILVGDGRSASDEDKISEDHIKPIANDKPLFTITLNPTAIAVADIAKTFVDDVVVAMEDYQGSGNVTAFIRKDLLTQLILLKDGQGYRLYKTQQELATAMMANRIVSMPKEIMGNNYAIFVDLSDYTVGADRGGAVNMFDDFDIDYNQNKYLIETRCSGMLTKPYAAIVAKPKADSTTTG